MHGLSSFHGGHSYHGDGEGHVLDIARSAADRDFAAFGFSEHFDRPPSNQFLLPQETDFLVDRDRWTDPYVKAVQEARSQFAGVLPIRLGTEIEYIRDGLDWTLSALAKWPFEYLVGSVHYLRYETQDVAIDCNRGRVEEALKRAGTAEQLQLDYYDHVLELLDWNLVQIVGHLDLIKVYLDHEEASPTSPVRAKTLGVLETMRDQGVALDVNAAGLRKPCRDIYPAGWILEAAAGIGVPITLGDDSHGPDQVGLGLDEAVEAVGAAGYSSVWIVADGGVLEEGPLPTKARKSSRTSSA